MYNIIHGYVTQKIPKQSFHHFGEHKVGRDDTDRMEQNLNTMSEISTTTTAKQDADRMEENETTIAITKTATSTTAKQEFKTDAIMVDNGDLCCNIIDKPLNWNMITRLVISLLLHFLIVSSMVVVDAESRDNSAQYVKERLKFFSKELSLGIYIIVGYASVSLLTLQLIEISLYSFTIMKEKGMYLFM